MRRQIHAAIGDGGNHRNQLQWSDADFLADGDGANGRRAPLGRSAQQAARLARQLHTGTAAETEAANVLVEVVGTHLEGELDRGHVAGVLERLVDRNDAVVFSLVVVNDAAGDGDLAALAVDHVVGPGDALIEVFVRPHASFTRDSYNILLHLPVTLAEIVLGARVPVPTTTGSVTVSIPPNSSNGVKLRLRGKGWWTLLVAESSGSLVAISDSAGIAIENLAAVGAASPNATGQGADGGGLIDARNTLGLELSQLYLLGLSPGDARSLGLSLSGYALGIQVRDCAIVADVGIAGGQGKTGYLLMSTVAVTESLLLCQRRGIDLARRCLHLGQTRIADNLILGAREAGVRVVGAAFPGAGVTFERNVLQLSGDGIVAGVDGLRILDNELRGADSKAVGSGVVLETGLDPRGVGHCWITGNRIADLSEGTGIAVRTALGSAMIKQNMIERTRRGIAFTAAGAATRLSIENNHLVDIALGFNPESESVVAIQVLAAAYADLTGNVVSGFAANALQAPDRVAIRIIGGGDIRLSGNHLSDLGPGQEYRGYVAGIELVAPFALALRARREVLALVELALPYGTRGEAGPRAPLVGLFRMLQSPPTAIQRVRDMLAWR